MKTNQHVAPTVADDFQSVSFEVKGYPTLVLNMGKLHADIVRRAAAVGMAQVRIVDAAAVPAADKDGNIIPEATRIAMKYERMKALVEHYESGTSEWSRVSEGGGGGKSITVEAIAAEKGITYEEAEAMVEEFAKKAPYNGDTKKALAFLRQGAKLAARMDEIRKARMPAPKVDADAALAELK